MNLVPKLLVKTPVEMRRNPPSANIASKCSGIGSHGYSLPVSSTSHINRINRYMMPEAMRVRQRIPAPLAQVYRIAMKMPPNEGERLPHRERPRIAACSRDEPIPKFLPAQIISPGRTFETKSGSSSQDNARHHFRAFIYNPVPEHPYRRSHRSQVLAFIITPSFSRQKLPRIDNFAGHCHPATVYGLPRYTSDEAAPMRPRKFRAVDAMHTSPSASTPAPYPAQAPHPSAS